jgi:hypothetical protein
MLFHQCISGLIATTGTREQVWERNLWTNPASGKTPGDASGASPYSGQPGAASGGTGGLPQSYHRIATLSLTAREPETVITFSDDDDVATVHTHQRRIITKLQNNPAAEQIEDISFDGTAGAVFELPVWAISFLSKKRKGGPGNASTLQKAREARELAVVSTESGREAA